MWVTPFLLSLLVFCKVYRAGWSCCLWGYLFMLLPRSRADRKGRERRQEGWGGLFSCWQRYAWVTSWCATPRPPSPQRNIAFPEQLKSWKFKVESCYGCIQALLFKPNTAWVFGSLEDLTINHISLWYLPYHTRSKNVPHSFFCIFFLSLVLHLTHAFAVWQELLLVL